MSCLASNASLGDISGSGLAIAKIIGLSFMVKTISFETTFPIDSPIKTSDPLKVSSKVLQSVSTANSSFCLFKFSRPLYITPLLSHIRILLGLAPRVINSLAHDIADAPAPFMLILISDICLPINSQAFTRPAAEIIAVPCWSS